MERSYADEFVDELLPTDFEWRRMVRSYPLTSAAVAFAGGFLIGRQRGMGLLSGLASFVVNEVSENVQNLFEGAAENLRADFVDLADEVSESVDDVIDDDTPLDGASLDDAFED